MSQFYLNDKGQWTQRVAGDLNIASSDIQQPVDIQSRYQQTIQTHNAVSVGANSTSPSSTWIDCNGFSEIAITTLSDANTANYANIQWSNDGVSVHGKDYAVTPSNNNNPKAGSVPTKARYAKVELYNGDTVAHTMSAWAYLKA